MSLVIGFMSLFSIYIIWKLFIDGWLFKIILFIAGWFGLYVGLRTYVEGATNIAVTFGKENPVSFTWAAVAPTIVCFLCLLCTKVEE